ncbi:MAG: hypothetical protein ABII90_13435 [Bacteroidota bacterium]
MKKHAILSTIIFLIPFLVFAQLSKDFSYSVSKPYKVVDASEKHYFHRGGEILSIKITGKRTIIHKFDSEKLIFIKEKVYEDMPKGFKVEKVTEFNDRYYFFYSLWDKPNEKEQLFYREIDFESGTFIGEGKLIIKVDGKITGSPIGSVYVYWSFGVIDKFNFQISYDESKLLIQYRKKPKIRDDSKNYDVIGMNVFDKNIEPVWSEEVKMPYTEKKMNNLDYSIDSEGNTYILSTVYDDNTTDIKKSRDGKANYHIELLRIEANSGEIDKTPIEVGDKFINNIWLFESPENYMVSAGFYSDGKDLDDADGVFIFKVEKEGEIYDMASYEIPVEILNQYVKGKVQKENIKKEAKDKAEFEELELRELRIKKDGSIILIGEQHYIISHTTYSNGKSRTYYTYHYNDMLITKIEADGELAWMKKLPKRQTGKKGQGGMSYQYIYSEDNHYLLFLDNVKNMNLSLNKVPAGHTDGAGGFLTAYKIDDSEGLVSKASILDTKNVKGMPVYQFETNKIFSVSSNEFVFEVYKKSKEDVLIKVAVKE